MRKEEIVSLEKVAKRLESLLEELVETFDEFAREISSPKKIRWDVPKKMILKNQVLERRPKQIKIRNRL